MINITEKQLKEIIKAVAFNAIEFITNVDKATEKYVTPLLEEAKFPIRHKLTVTFTPEVEMPSLLVYSYDGYEHIKSEKKRIRKEYKGLIEDMKESKGEITIIDNPPIDENSFDGSRAKYQNEPEWIEEETTLWGKGFMDGIYVANKDYSKVVRLIEI